MKNHRAPRRHRSREASYRRPPRRQVPLRFASLGSPLFVETWNGGSPLNWVEFMGGWERARSDRRSNNSDD